MSISEQEKSILLGYLWALKPSDLSVLQGCLMEKGSQIGTVEGSCNNDFLSYLVLIELAKDVTLEIEELPEAKAFSLTKEGEDLLPKGIKFIFNNGYPPKEAIFNRASIGMLVKYSSEGNSISQNKLATLLEKGIGIVQNYEEAHKLYGRAAQADCPKSKYDLGRLYAEGKGVKASYVEAYRCFRLADEGGFDAKKEIKVVKQKLTNHEIKMMDSLCTDRKSFEECVVKNFERHLGERGQKEKSVKNGFLKRILSVFKGKEKQ